MPRLGAFLVVLTTFVVLAAATAPPARADWPSGDINLEDYGLRHLSQVDPRWSWYAIGPTADYGTVGQFGCALTSLSMIASYYNLIPKVHLSIPGVDMFMPHPVYIDRAIQAANAYALGGICIPCYDWELAVADAFMDPMLTSIHVKLRSQPLWPGGRDDVNVRVAGGVPSILIFSVDANDQGKLRKHAVVVAGWDTESSSYLLLDPALQRGARARTAKELYGPQWEQRIVHAVTIDEVSGAGGGLGYLALWVGSPVELSVVDPAGRRAGFDPATGQTLLEIPGASYVTAGFADPTGVIPPDPDPAKVLVVSEPAVGTYRFRLVGTGDGPYTLNFKGFDDAGNLVLDDVVAGTIVAGGELLYQVARQADGQMLVAAGINFAPEVRVAAVPPLLLGAPAQLDGSASFDVDGTIVAYDWTFGDGQTGTGAQVAHTYAAAGQYQATLTVTDDQGATASAATRVWVVDGAVGGHTERVSVSTAGDQTNADCLMPAISADGRSVSFTSWASNLAGGLAGHPDVFVRDRQSGTTELMSDASGTTCVFGAIESALSGDGRSVAFVCNYVNSGGTGAYKVMLRDRTTGTLEQVDVKPNGDPATCPDTACGSRYPVVSADGRFVAFQSSVSELVADDTNGVVDVFVRDRVAGTTTRVNVTSAGAQSAWEAVDVGMSGDGRWVVFTSYAQDLVPGATLDVYRVYLKDLQTGALEVASVSLTGINGYATARSGAVSGDGRFVAFAGGPNFVAGDTNNAFDIFVRDRQLGTTERASVSSTGEQGVSPGFPISGDARDPAISADGSTVVFRGEANNLVPFDSQYTDVFARDRVHGTTELVSATPTGTNGNDSSGEGHFINDPTRIAVSADGRFVAFSSRATDLVTGDTNGVLDCLVRDRFVPPAADPGGPYLGWATDGAIELDASRSASPTGVALTATWDFGDGTTATAAAATPVTHSYASAGTYTITLVVDGGVASAPVATTATVFPPNPPRSLGVVPSCAAAGGSVELTLEHLLLVPRTKGWNLATGDVPAPSTVFAPSGVAITVSGGGGGPGEVIAPIAAVWQETPLEASARLVYDLPAGLAAGTYDVTLTAAPTLGAQLTTPCPTPSNYPPVARVGGPYTGVTGQPVQFDGTASSDPEGAALSYEWYFGDFDDATGAGPTPTHAYPAAGTYYAMLVVDDGELASDYTFDGDTLTTVTITDPGQDDGGVAEDGPAATEDGAPAADDGPTAGADAGGPGGGSSGGCGCRAAGEASTAGTALLLLALGLGTARRRRG
jgi:MYXO-CTERM domain-containing protein